MCCKCRLLHLLFLKYLPEQLPQLLQNRFKEESNNDIDEEFILKKIEERNTAKQNKDYALADQIRNELLELGITLKDTREGTIYEK